MTRSDSVSSELAAEVFARDEYSCVAPRLDPGAGRCSSALRLEHVKLEPRMGQRASVTVDGRRRASASVLVTLCEAHTEVGMLAGRVWCTAKVNRERCRDYLRSFAT